MGFTPLSEPGGFRAPRPLTAGQQERLLPGAGPARCSPSCGCAGTRTSQQGASHPAPSLLPSKRPTGSYPSPTSADSPPSTRPGGSDLPTRQPRAVRCERIPIALSLCRPAGTPAAFVVERPSVQASLHRRLLPSRLQHMALSPCGAGPPPPASPSARGPPWKPGAPPACCAPPPTPGVAGPGGLPSGLPWAVEGVPAAWYQGAGTEWCVLCPGQRWHTGHSHLQASGTEGTDGRSPAPLRRCPAAASLLR